MMVGGGNSQSKKEGREKEQCSCVCDTHTPKKNIMTQNAGVLVSSGGLSASSFLG